MSAVIFWTWVYIVLLVAGLLVFGWLAIGAIVELNWIKAVIALPLGWIVLPRSALLAHV